MRGNALAPLLLGALPLLAAVALKLLYLAPERSRLEAEVAEMRDTVERGNAALALLPGLRERSDALRAEARAYEAAVPERPPNDRVVAELRRASSASGVRLARVSASYLTEEGLSVARYQVALSGRFPALVRALEELEASGLVFWVPEASLRSGSGALEATVVVVVPYGRGGCALRRRARVEVPGPRPHGGGSPREGGASSSEGRWPSWRQGRSSSSGSRAGVGGRFPLSLPSSLPRAPSRGGRGGGSPAAPGPPPAPSPSPSPAPGGSPPLPGGARRGWAEDRGLRPVPRYGRRPEAREGRSPRPLSLPFHLPYPGGSPAPGLSPLEVRYLGFASGVRAAGAFSVGGEVVVLEVGRELSLEGGRLRVVALGPKEAVVVLNGKRTALRVEGER